MGFALQTVVLNAFEILPPASSTYTLRLIVSRPCFVDGNFLDRFQTVYNFHMTKVCDNKSVGMLIKRGEKVLLIERRKPPFGFAPPAGHLDGDTFEHSAIRETEEEVGLKVNKVTLLVEGKKENKCRRIGGNWHYWKICQVETVGDIKRSEDETKQANWYSADEIEELAKKTESYLSGTVSRKEWEKSPGIEPVWYEWFRELNLL
jgi:ADP-ribose pyrophosphatase YjhB (NUDIX family)